MHVGKPRWTEKTSVHVGNPGAPGVPRWSVAYRVYRVNDGGPVNLGKPWFARYTTCTWFTILCRTSTRFRVYEDFRSTVLGYSSRHGACECCQSRNAMMQRQDVRPKPKIGAANLDQGARE